MKTRKIICYVVGSVILFAVACSVIPKVIGMITNKAYKDSVKRENSNVDEDDWGPELVKKNKSEEK